MYLGHADFFKNNYWFSGTNRKMMDVMANHGTKIRRYMDTHGIEKVEAFIDRVLSIENLLDVNLLFGVTNNDGAKRSDDETHDELDGHSDALKSFLRSKARYDQEKKIHDDSR